MCSRPQSCNCLAFSANAPTRPKRKLPPPASSLKTFSDLNAAVTLTPKDEKPILPHVAAGYSDGTVRMFDLNKVEMILKMHPHAVSVTAISFASDGMRCSLVIVFG